MLVLMDGDRTPLGAVIAAAHEHESRHIERLVDSAVVELPDEHRLLYDGAADSDPLRERLAARGIDLICPHRANRVKPPIQDGRKLRRRRHRWRVERTNAWLHNYGRIAHPQRSLGHHVPGLGSTRLPVHYSQEVVTEVQVLVGNAWRLCMSASLSFYDCPARLTTIPSIEIPSLGHESSVSHQAGAGFPCSHFNPLPQLRAQ